MNQYILRLYISMNDVIVVHEVYCVSNLLCNFLNLFLSKAYLLFKVVVKISSWAVL